MGMRFMLRARIEALHVRLDRIIEVSCFGDVLDLGRFLGIHHRALSAVIPALERAGAARILPGWEGRSRLSALEADMRELCTRALPNAGGGLAFHTEQEVWGALYALEGSRLGNRVLLRRVAERGGDVERRATRFLAHGLEDGEAWPRFVTRLEALDCRSETFEVAVLGAETVFGEYLAATSSLPDHCT